MIVMVVGGPNTRVDFHDDPVEEWFYQVRGDMMLKIAENGEFYDIPIRQGVVFMLPPPYAPRPTTASRRIGWDRCRKPAHGRNEGRL